MDDVFCMNCNWMDECYGWYFGWMLFVDYVMENEWRFIDEVEMYGVVMCYKVLFFIWDEFGEDEGWRFLVIWSRVFEILRFRVCGLWLGVVFVEDGGWWYEFWFWGGGGGWWSCCSSEGERVGVSMGRNDIGSVEVNVVVSFVWNNGGWDGGCGDGFVDECVVVGLYG